MDIKVKGIITAGRLREFLALIEAGGDITWHFDGRLQLRAAASPQTGVPRIDIPANHDGFGDAEPEYDVEIEDEDWDGPVPAYIGGVVDNSPQEIEQRRLFREESENQKRRRAEANESERRRSQEHTMDKEVFGRLRLRYGQRLIDAINAEIAAVWREVNPVFSQNCKDGKAGQPRLMPQLEMRDETVWVHGFNSTGTMKRIATPVSISDSSLGSKPLWKYKEWVEHAVPRIKAVIDRYAEEACLVKVGVKGGTSD